MALPEKTIYERWEERGLEQGLHQGRLEEARRWLLRLLELRFGPPDETVRRRVAALDDLDELERLGDRLPTAASPEDLGLA